MKAIDQAPLNQLVQLEHQVMYERSKVPVENTGYDRSLFDMKLLEPQRGNQRVKRSAQYKKIFGNDSLFYRTALA